MSGLKWYFAAAPAIVSWKPLHKLVLFCCLMVCYQHLCCASAWCINSWRHMTERVSVWQVLHNSVPCPRWVTIFHVTVGDSDVPFWNCTIKLGSADQIMSKARRHLYKLWSFSARPGSLEHSCFLTRFCHYWGWERWRVHKSQEGQSSCVPKQSQIIEFQG